MKIVSLVWFGVLMSIVKNEDTSTVQENARTSCFTKLPEEEDVGGDSVERGGRSRRGAEDTDSETQVPDRTATLLDVATTKLAFKLLSLITSQKEMNENVFFSPQNIMNSVLMVLFSSSADTRTDLLKAVFLEGRSYEEVLSTYQSLQSQKHAFITDETKIFYRQELQLKPEFEKIVGDRTEIIDFDEQNEALESVNDWASHKTQEHIKTLSEDSFPVTTESLLFGVAMFELQWDYKFQHDQTTKQSFTTCSGGQVEVDMMTRISTTPYLISDVLKAQVITLPFQHHNYRFLIVLPHQDQTIEGLISKLDENRLREAMGSLKEKDIKLLLPKFTTVTEVPLEGILESLGADVIGDKGDFSNMFDEGHLNEAKHKSAITVDETGTDGLVYGNLMENSITSPEEVRVDRPFFIHNIL